MKITPRKGFENNTREKKTKREIREDGVKNIKNRALKLKEKVFRKFAPHLNGYFAEPDFSKVLKSILILLAIGFVIKLLVFNYLPERKHIDLLGNLFWIYHKDHYCDYLDLNETTQAWLRLMLLMWNCIGLFSLTVEKEKHDKIKIVYRCFAVGTIFAVFTVNNVMGLELFNTFRYLMIMAAFYIGFIEIRPDWIKSPWMINGLILLISGSAGNIFEQFFRGYVVDYMILFPFLTRNYVWNFEDVLGIIGSSMIVIYVMLQMRRIILEPTPEEAMTMKMIREWDKQLTKNSQDEEYDFEGD